jgi:hypothetical protein
MRPIWSPNADAFSQKRQRARPSRSPARVAQQSCIDARALGWNRLPGLATVNVGLVRCCREKSRQWATRAARTG